MGHWMTTWTVLYVLAVGAYWGLTSRGGNLCDLATTFTNVSPVTIDRCSRVLSGAKEWLDEKTMFYARYTQIQNIDNRILEAFPGEEEFAARLGLTIKRVLQGKSADAQGPTVLRLVGPVGTGKRRLAKVLVDILLHGQPKENIVLNQLNGDSPWSLFPSDLKQGEGLVIENTIQGGSKHFYALGKAVQRASRGSWFIIIDDINDYGVSPSMASSLELNDAQDLLKQALREADRLGLGKNELIIPFLPKSIRVIEANIARMCSTFKHIICPVHAVAQAAFKLGVCVDAVGFERAIELFRDAFNRSVKEGVNQPGPHALEVLITVGGQKEADRDEAAGSGLCLTSGEIDQWLSFRPLRPF